MMPRRRRPSPSPREHGHSHDHGHSHQDEHGHGHSQGLVDRSILRSRDGARMVAISLAILGVTALAQAAVFALSGSVALLADTIHNFGDALMAIAACDRVPVAVSPR